MVFKVLTSLLIFVHVVFGTVEPEIENSLKLVHVFVRHGARYPQTNEIYPNDPHKFAENDLGQLNKVGKANSYKVGKFLRSRYGSYLGDTFQHGIIQATSTALPRTKMTALLVLAGLFPPTVAERWSDEIPNWQPIPYSYLDYGSDTWLQKQMNYCPKYKEEIKKVENSPIIENLFRNHAETMEFIRNKTGKNITDLEGVFRLYQLLSSEDSLNLPLPDWLRPPIMYFLMNLTVQRYVLENSNNDLTRLSGGRMLSKVTESWNKKINDEIYPANTKMFLYSVHEHNIVNLMFALDIFNYQFPKYSSAIIFELHQERNSGNHNVRVLHLEDVNKPPVVKRLKDCHEMCPLAKFLNHVKDVLPKNYTKECESKRQLDIPEWIPLHLRKKKF